MWNLVRCNRTTLSCLAATRAQTLTTVTGKDSSLVRNPVSSRGINKPAPAVVVTRRVRMLHSYPNFAATKGRGGSDAHPGARESGGPPHCHHQVLPDCCASCGRGVPVPSLGSGMPCDGNLQLVCANCKWRNWAWSVRHKLTSLPSPRCVHTTVGPPKFRPCDEQAHTRGAAATREPAWGVEHVRSCHKVATGGHGYAGSNTRTALCCAHTASILSNPNEATSWTCRYVTIEKCVHCWCG